MLKLVVTTILTGSYERINEDNFARDCLPEPPTPTNKALPTGRSIILAILVICSIA